MIPTHEPRFVTEWEREEYEREKRKGEETTSLRARIAELEKENGLLKDKLWALSNPARYAAGYRREL